MSCTKSAERFVLFTGSRTWTDYFTIYRVVRRLHVLLGSFTALHGKARGADIYVGLAARLQGIPEEPDPVTPAEWERYGKPAGNMRNTRMLERAPILVVGFWTGEADSTGTPDCLLKAINIYRIPTLVYTGPVDH